MRTLHIHSAKYWLFLFCTVLSVSCHAAPSKEVIWLLMQQAEHMDKLNREEKEKQQKFLNDYVAQLEELSAAEMQEEAKSIAAQINRGIDERRNVHVKLIDGEKLQIRKRAEIDGYWITLYAGYPHYYEGVWRWAARSEKRVRASSILSVTVDEVREPWPKEE